MLLDKKDKVLDEWLVFRDISFDKAEPMRRIIQFGSIPVSVRTTF
jgi:hypothetical protein